MNTSRDIEKLFDHFGGNAREYQEIGRENEAQSARTRWPLLATLDLAQPPIPEIAPRSDGRADAPRPRAPQAMPAPDESTAAPAPTPTPINRGKPPLFARAHRRTIPPVNAKESLDALSGSRFSALKQSAESEAEAKKPEVTPQAPSAEFGRVAQAQTQTQAPLFPRRQTQTQTPEASPSILGKLFDAPKPAPSAPASNALNALFDRLRASGDDPHNDQDNRPARAWAARS